MRTKNAPEHLRKLAGWTFSFILLTFFSSVALAQPAKKRTAAVKKPVATNAAQQNNAETDQLSSAKFQFVAKLGLGSGGGREEKIEDDVSEEWLKELEKPAPAQKQTDARREAFELARKSVTDGLNITNESKSVLFSPTELESMNVVTLKFAAAENQLQNALRLVPDDAGYYRNGLGVAFYMQLKFKRAERLFRRAIEVNPQESLFHENLLQALQAQEKTSEFETQLRASAELYPASYRLQRRWGDFLFARKLYAEAEIAFRNAVKAPKPDAQALYETLLGNALFEQKKFAEAESTYRSALEKQKAATYRTDLQQSIVKSLRGQKKFKETEEFLDQLINAAAGWDKATFLTELGLTFEEQNKFDDAERVYQEALAAAPTHNAAKEKLAQLRQKRQP